MSPQRLNEEEVFEDEYTDSSCTVPPAWRRCQVRARQGGERPGDPPDGTRLTRPFERPGLVPAQRTPQRDLQCGTAGASATVPVRLDLDDIKKWYAAPEAVYIVVYLEASGRVHRRRRQRPGRPGVRRLEGNTYLEDGRALSQKTVTLHVSTDSVVDEAMIGGLLRHKSMRVDGPAWRGRPLGHRFDPLRTELANLDTGYLHRARRSAPDGS